MLNAGRAITPLLEDARVVDRWGEPSALAELSIGGLAGHLVRALETIEVYLDEPEPPDEGLIDASVYFAGGTSAPIDLDNPAQRAIRERGEQAGAVGPAALAADHQARIGRLATRLASEPATRRVTVMRGAARMTLDAYLPTRLVEITVHADDLAVSVGADTPPFGSDVMAAVIDVLVGTARHRYGDLAVIRAMTRRERDEQQALRVL